MPDWNALRRRAYVQHQQLRAHLPSDAPLLPPAEQILSAAEAATEVDRRGVPAHDSLLAGAHAVLDRDFPCIWYATGPDTSRVRQRFAQAHEFAHYWLHPEVGEDHCSADDSAEAFAPPTFRVNSSQVAEGYSHKERRESEANLFAAELLLPGPILRRLFLDYGWSANRIAAHSGLSHACVLSQLTSALLLPVPSPEIARENEAEGEGKQAHSSASSGAPLDHSQRAAAEIAQGPALVDAGPGTGKTRTLIARILFLLTECGVTPENILALTFSNKAAEEMHTRLRAAAGDLADRVWIGTFHAFGRELLRKEGVRLGLSLSAELIDLPDAVKLLEDNVDRLELQHFEYLNQPILPFPDILECISRAKDELVTPARFASLAQHRLDLAAQRQREAEQCPQKREQRALYEAAEQLRLVGEKWREVAQVYRVYQDLLQENDKLDFGDLLMRAVELLDSFPEVCLRWQKQFPHILADEYQDINRASAQLVQRLAGEGKGLWAVGDLRQAIYRFRGASPANVREFDVDFPGAQRVQLERNYRSLPPLVSLFGAYAGSMAGTSATFADWQPHRALRPNSEAGIFLAESEADEQVKPLPAVTLAVAEDEEAQADGMAAQIRDWTARGISPRDQVILCYTHQQASRLSERLGARGIETQHLGGLFERTEVKDLFAVLSLLCEPEGTALRRVARFAQYAIPDEDVLTLFQVARERKEAFPGLLQSAGSLQGISPRGRAGLTRLWHDLRPLLHLRSAWTLLTGYLFETSDYLRPLVKEGSIASQQRLLAINELLAAALRLQKRFELEENAPLAFLSHLRYLLSCRQEKTLRMAGDGGDLDGVRLMTIHKSKGLEFPVVYLPNLVKDQFPTRKVGRMVMPPQDWADESAVEAAVPDEETGEDGIETENLFFVALSRARDALVLSRPLTWNGKPVDPSPLLVDAEPALQACHAHRVHWLRHDAPNQMREEDSEKDSEKDSKEAPDTEPSASLAPLNLSASTVEMYRDCPRRYYYDRVLQLPRRRETTPYMACRSAWQATVKWLQAERSEGRAPTREEAQAQLRTEWNRHSKDLAGAQGRVLWERAQGWLDVAQREVKQAQNVTPILELEARLEHGTVRVPVDHAELSSEDGLRLVDFKTRRNDKEDHKNIRLALARHAARQQQPERPVQIVVGYLADGEQREIAETTRYEPDRVKKYDEALQNIQEGRFDPNPSPARCAECPFFLVCPL